MEYWSVGVLGEIKTEEDNLRFIHYSKLIIRSVKVNGNNKIRLVCATHIDHTNRPGNVFSLYSITPLLHYSNTSVPSLIPK